MIYYHGTLSKNIDNIKINGLVVNPPASFEKIHGFTTKGKIYLATNYNDAFYYVSIFAKEPITILVLEIPTMKFKLEQGYSYAEKVSKNDIPASFIKGAFNKESEFINLVALNSSKNYVDLNQLKGKEQGYSDKERAMKDFVSMKTAKDKNSYDHGCLMAPVPEVVYETIKSVSKDIPIENLLIDEENTIHGIESRPHITIMYGIDDDDARGKIEKIFIKPLKIKITNEIGYFDKDDKSVAYFKIESSDLEKLNTKLVKTFPFENENDEYIAHMTIAYLKPSKRIKTKFEPIEFEVKYVVLSKKDGSTEEIHLDGEEKFVIKSKIIDLLLKEARIIEKSVSTCNAQKI